jgi:uncharacterized protein (UPF0332 family)
MALNEEASSNFFNHTMELWFNPELQRMKQIGMVSEEYEPEKMQVILFPTGEKRSIVNFDNDVVSVEKLRANRNYENCGHITFKKVNGNWEGNFDGRFNKGKAQELFKTAQEFFETAKNEYNAKRMRTFVDTLFSATELLVTSKLIVMSEQKYVEKPNHKLTKSKFSSFVKLGNAKVEYSKMLGRLSAMRDEARYHKRPFNLEDSVALEYLKTAEELAEYVRSSIT